MKKILTILFLYFTVFYQAFALEVGIKTDKKEIFQNEELKLTIDIKNVSDLEKLEISKNNLEQNFEIIGISQSNKIFSSAINNSWILEEEKEVLTSYSFILKPKQTWKLIIWPIEIKNWNEKIDTDKLEIKVLEEEKNDKILSETNTWKIFGIKDENIKKAVDTDYKSDFIFKIIMSIFIFLTFFLFLTYIIRLYFLKNKFKK